MPVSYWYVTSHTKLVASNDSSALVMFSAVWAGLGLSCSIDWTCPRVFYQQPTQPWPEAHVSGTTAG